MLQIILAGEFIPQCKEKKEKEIHFYLKQYEIIK